MLDDHEAPEQQAHAAHALGIRFQLLLDACGHFEGVGAALTEELVIDKRVAELGICGVAAAISNAIYNATGARVRDYPVTLDKLLARMPSLVLPELG